jgi:hypothetical protein
VLNLTVLNCRIEGVAQQLRVDPLLQGVAINVSFCCAIVDRQLSTRPVRRSSRLFTKVS